VENIPNFAKYDAFEDITMGKPKEEAEADVVENDLGQMLRDA
jgi:hypothetical protein